MVGLVAASIGRRFNIKSPYRVHVGVREQRFVGAVALDGTGTRELGGPALAALRSKEAVQMARPLVGEEREVL